MANIACSECGAPEAPEDGCRRRFDVCEALELTDPAYAGVHHLTVSAYMLQHPTQLSVRGWHELRDLLGRFLNDGASPMDFRNESRRAMSSGRRDWRVTGEDSIILPKGFEWQRTIPELSAAAPDAYAESIEAWARAVLADSAAVS
jgi:hypothetical protein